MLLGVEALGLRALAVLETETNADPAVVAFAAIEDNATIDLVYLIELYPLNPPVVT